MEGKITVKYKDISSFECNQALTKIANTPTSAAKASLIRNIIRAIQPVREQISKDYEEKVLKHFAAKDEQGNLIHQEDGKGYKSVEGKDEEIKKATEEFGNTEVEIEAVQLNPTILSDIKMSAKELEALKDLFTESAGPGVPQGFPQMAQGDNVSQLRQ